MPFDSIRNRDRLLDTEFDFNTPATGEQSIRSVLSETMPFMNKMRDRDLQDLAAQMRIRKIFSQPASVNPQLKPIVDPAQPRNVVFVPPASEQNKIDPLDMAKLGLQKEELGIRREDLKLKERFGEEKVNLNKGELELNQKKNQQIYETKIADMERKMNDSNNTLKLAYDRLQANRDSAEAQANYRAAQLASVNARAEAQQALNELKLQQNAALSEARIRQINKAIEDAGMMIQETTVSEDGTRRTTVTKKGEAAKDNKADPIAIRPGVK